MSATLGVSPAMRTSRTRMSAPGAKLPMPRLQNGRLPLPDMGQQRGERLGVEADVTCEGDRLQPELGGAAAGVGMDVGRLVRLMAVEMELRTFSDWG